MPSCLAKSVLCYDVTTQPFNSIKHFTHVLVSSVSFIYTDSFAVGEEGTILKKLQENEKSVLEQLMSDALMPFVPKYNGVVTIEADRILLHTVLSLHHQNMAKVISFSYDS